MTERLRSESFSNTDFKPKKIGEDLGPGKTLVILVIVIGCFAVLCPNVFYPMLFGSPQNHIKPSPIDRTTGCCDVISETDVNTIRIMSELCRTLIKHDDETHLSGREIVNQCQKAVLETCGIDISAVLQERVTLGHTTKHILDEIRSLNGSLCLKYNFGVSPWRLGVPHRVTIKVSPSPSLRQERPSHLRSEMVHPAFRERGRAIPTQQPSPSRPPPRIVEGKPGPMPGMRPTIGGAGKVIPPPKQTTGTMGLIMPIYTIGIVILFTYTVMKVLFKKQQESLYPPVEPDPVFRKEVFEANRGHSSSYNREPPSNKLVVNAMSALLDQVDKELAAQLQTSDIEEEVAANRKFVSQEDQGSVKIVGMEMTASCEGNKKWSRSDSPVVPPPTIHPTPTQPIEPPHEIFLEVALPPQSNHLLVSDSATETQKITEEDPAVVLAGKMTLSVLSLDSDNGMEDSNVEKKLEERSSSNVSEDFEKIESCEFLDDQLNEDSSSDKNVVNEIGETTIETVENSDKNELKLTEVSTESPVALNSIVEDLTKMMDEDNETKIIETATNKDSVDKEVELCESELDRIVEIQKIVSDSIENVPFKIDIVETQEKEKIDNEATEKNINQILQLSEEKLSEDEEQIPIAIQPNTAVGIGRTDLEEKVENVILGLTKEVETNFSKVEHTWEDGNKENITDEIENSAFPKSEKLPDTDSAMNSTEMERVVETFESQIPKIDDKPENNIILNEQQDKNVSAKEVTEKVAAALILCTDGTNGNASAQALTSEPSEDNSSNEYEKIDVDDEIIEDENVEYEYEMSDGEDDDEELRNIERLEEDISPRVNGEDHEPMKDETTNNDTLAENIISDEEVLNDDEEMEEIIEYVTDDEEEEAIEELHPPNNTNHLDHNSSRAN